MEEESPNQTKGFSLIETIKNNQLLITIIILVSVLGLTLPLGYQYFQLKSNGENDFKQNKPQAYIYNPTPTPGLKSFTRSSGTDLWQSVYRDNCEEERYDEFKMSLGEIGINLVNPENYNISTVCGYLGNTFIFTFTDLNGTKINLTPEYYTKSYIKQVGANEQQYAVEDEGTKKANATSKILEENEEYSIKLMLRTGCDPTPGCTIEQTGLAISGEKTLRLSNGDEIRITSISEIVERGEKNQKLIKLLQDNAELDTLGTSDPYVASFDVNLLYKDFGEEIEKRSKAMETILSSISANDKLLSQEIFINDAVDLQIRIDSGYKVETAGEKVSDLQIGYVSTQNEDPNSCLARIYYASSFVDHAKIVSTEKYEGIGYTATIESVVQMWSGEYEGDDPNKDLSWENAPYGKRPRAKILDKNSRKWVVYFCPDEKYDRYTIDQAVEDAKSFLSKIAFE